jgi:Sec-independent protein translocase protein (TatC)
VLFQIWLFISPGMYAHEKRYVWPFMSATIGLFLAGAYFGYRWVLPGALKVLVLDYGHRFHPILTIEDYTGFFLAIILGLGIAFELPILMFFLALFGMVDARFLLRNFKYGILLIFVIAGVIAGPLEYVPLRLSPARSLLARRRSSLPRPPIAEEVEGYVTRRGTRHSRSCPRPIVCAVERPTSGQLPFTDITSLVVRAFQKLSLSCSGTRIGSSLAVVQY